MKQFFNKFILFIKIVFHGPFDTSTKEGRSNERLRRVIYTALTSVITKIFSAAIPLITIRLSYDYLGKELYGLWAAILSFFSLFAFADLGLGNGLRTKLGIAYGLGNKTQSKALVTNTFLMLLFFSLIFMLIFIALFKIVNWNSLMNSSSTKTGSLTSAIVLAVVIPRLMSIPFSVVTRTQLALQEGYKSNIWQSSATLMSLIIIVLVVKFDKGKILMIWGASLATLIISIINMFVYFEFDKKYLKPSIRYYDKEISLSLLKTGLLFFVLSVFTTLSLTLDNYIVVKTSSLSEAATYSILFKLASLISIACVMISTPMWAAFSEAFAKGEKEWVEKYTMRISLISLTISIIASVIIMIASNKIFSLWIGKDFVFSKALLLGMCIMQMLLSYIAPYFMVLNSVGVIKKQVIVFIIYFVISFPLKYFISLKYGVTYIPWIGAGFYLILIVPLIKYFVKKVYINSSRWI